MIYFSYNDFMDCTESGEIYKLTKVEEKIAKYEIRNGKQVQKNKNHIIETLKEKTQLKNFLKEIFNFNQLGDIENIIYCNNIKSISDKEIENNITCKVKNKEIYIFIKVIENTDNNISYKMFENSLNIIKKWNSEEKAENKRYPIVVPIVIYRGKEKWKNNNNRKNNKINYITYEDNRINFSYNMININDLANKYLQIN